MDTKNNFRDPLFSLLDRAGRRLKPKTVLVELPASTADAGIFAAYTMAQGKQAGRKTDFSDSFHIDGLIVNRFTPPDCGLVLMLPQLSDFEVDSFEVDLRKYSQWDEAYIDQVLVTNGRRWTAFVREHGGQLIVREVFISPEHIPAAALPGSNQDMPSPFSEFEQCLARALMSWKHFGSPDTLGAFFASCAKSRLIDFARDGDHARILDLYAKALEDRLGITYPDFGGEMFPLCHFIAASLLANVSDALQRHWNFSPEIIAPDEMGLLYEGVRSAKHPQALDHIHIVADTLGRNTHPDFVRSFCEVFWKTLTGDARGCDGWNRTSGDVFAAHVDFLGSYLAHAISFFPGIDDGRIGWVDMRAGTGSLLVAALSPTSPDDNRLRGEIHAIESDPVKFQVMRLRVLSAGAGAGVMQHGASPKIRLIMDNPLRNPRALPRRGDWDFCILGGDLRFTDERGTLTVGNPQLTKHHQQTTRDVFGIRTFDAEEPFAQYAALVEAFFQQEANAAALLFTPTTWLEKDAYVAVREALLEQAKAVAVNVLPDIFLDAVAARKDGSASVVLVKTPIGGSARVSGREIRYKEDMQFALQDSQSLVALSSSRDNRFSLLPAQTTPGYQGWPSIRELTVVNPLAGPSEQRGFSLVRHNPEELARQMRDYFDPRLDNSILAERYPRLMADGPRYKAAKTRGQLLDRLFFNEKRIVPYPFKPFDIRWAYLDELRPLFKEPAGELQALAAIPGNAFLVVCEPNDRASTGLSAWFSPNICDYDFFAGTARHFPMYFHKTPRHGQRDAGIAPNLSGKALDYVRSFFPTGMEPALQYDTIPAEEILWYYMLAVLFTPSYILENADALRRDWPRIPIPFWKRPHKQGTTRSSMEFFVSQGRRIAELLSMKRLESGEWPVLGGVAMLADDAGWPITHGEWPLSKTWSVKSKINAVRPGKGETRTRHYTPKEEDELATALRNYRIDWRTVREAFGSKTVDVLLCDDIWWKNIPEAVWEFEIGGYKVLRKWLSYRGANVFGREMSVEDSVVFSDIAKRLTILVLMGLALDYAWPRLVQEAGK